MDRQTTPEEIEQGCVRLYRRLGRALDALDDGDVSAADDLAGILRTLIAEGKGDHAVFRLASARGLGTGSVLTSAPVETPPGLILGVGRLPVGRRRQARQGPVFTRTFEEWVKGTGIRTPRARTRSYSWADFVTKAGNTHGGHLSGTIAEVLDNSRVAEAAGFTLHHYLLRQVAWQTEVTLGSMLEALGHPVREEARPLELLNTVVSLFTLSEQRKGFGITGEWSASAFPAEIMAFEWEGHAFRISINADAQMEIAAPPGFKLR